MSSISGANGYLRNSEDRMFDEMEKVHRKLDFITRMLCEMDNKLTEILRRERIMSKELDNLTAQVTVTIGQEASAIVLIQGLAAQIAANANDPVAIQALSDQLKTSSDALAAAVVANPGTPVV
jgi:hypothetical protein